MSDEIEVPTQEPEAPQAEVAAPAAVDDGPAVEFELKHEFNINGICYPVGKNRIKLKGEDLDLARAEAERLRDALLGLDGNLHE